MTVWRSMKLILKVNFLLFVRNNTDSYLSCILETKTVLFHFSNITLNYTRWHDLIGMHWIFCSIILNNGLFSATFVIDSAPFFIICKVYIVFFKSYDSIKEVNYTYLVNVNNFLNFSKNKHKISRRSNFVSIETGFRLNLKILVRADGSILYKHKRWNWKSLLCNVQNI